VGKISRFEIFILQAVGLYPTNGDSVNKFILEDCCANILVVEEEKGVKKILAMKNDLQNLRKIVQVTT
jgi:hypothetical protein